MVCYKNKFSTPKHDGVSQAAMSSWWSVHPSHW
jgi:hypothetical protein